MFFKLAQMLTNLVQPLFSLTQLFSNVALMVVHVTAQPSSKSSALKPPQILLETCHYLLFKLLLYVTLNHSFYFPLLSSKFPTSGRCYQVRGMLSEIRLICVDFDVKIRSIGGKSSQNSLQTLAAFSLS